MAVKLYREYRIKFYLNMRHYIIIDGKKGEIHPHTWEFALDIKFGRSSFVEFNIFEKGIANFLEKYQNKVLNDEEPFDSIMPTLENVTDYFSSEFYRIIHDIGGMMTRFRGRAKLLQEVILLIWQSRREMHRLTQIQRI